MANINTAAVKQFQENVELLVQQKGSVLRNCVRLKTGVVGEDTYVDQIAATAAVKKTSRHGDTPLVNSSYARRKISMYDYEWADLIDSQDKLKMLADPTSEYVMNGGFALGRSMDDEIIASADGTAYTDKTGSTSTVLPSGQKVAAGSAGLTVAKLLAAKKILDNNDVDPDEERYCAVTGTQLSDLLNTTEVTSADYNSIKTLVEGKVDTFLGFKFKLTNRLTLSSSTRYVLAWARNGICLALAQDITSNITERSDKSYATQVYLKMGIGASRMEEEKVVQISCTES